MWINLRRSREEQGDVFTAVADVALEVTVCTSTANGRPETSLEKHVRAFSKAQERTSAVAVDELGVVASQGW